MLGVLLTLSQSQKAITMSNLSTIIASHIIVWSYKVELSHYYMLVKPNHGMSHHVIISLSQYPIVSITMSRHDNVTPSQYHTIAMSHCHIFKRSYYHNVTLSQYHTVTQWNFHIFTMSHHHILCYHAVTLSCHNVTLSHYNTSSHCQAIPTWYQHLIDFPFEKCLTIIA